jgi:hypothetical protein
VSAQWASPPQVEPPSPPGFQAPLTSNFPEPPAARGRDLVGLRHPHLQIDNRPGRDRQRCEGATAHPSIQGLVSRLAPCPRMRPPRQQPHPYANPGAPPQRKPSSARVPEMMESLMTRARPQFGVVYRFGSSAPCPGGRLTSPRWPRTQGELGRFGRYPRCVTRRRLPVSAVPTMRLLPFSLAARPARGPRCQQPGYTPISRPDDSR